jgi:hypothetical protein
MDAGAFVGSRGSRVNSPIGKQIVGGAWTTATVQYGSFYGGTDKFIDVFGNTFLTITNNEAPTNSRSNLVEAEDGDIYYISAISVNALPQVPLRIRRSSDDVEVDVAFDSERKVSASSEIINIAEQGGEIGRTTATDLNGFLNNEHTIDFESSSFSRIRFTRTDDQTIGGQIADKFD